MDKNEAQVSAPATSLRRQRVRRRNLLTVGRPHAAAAELVQLATPPSLSICASPRPDDSLVAARIDCALLAAECAAWRLRCRALFVDLYSCVGVRNVILDVVRIKYLVHGAASMARELNLSFSHAHSTATYKTERNQRPGY